MEGIFAQRKQNGNTSRVVTRLPTLPSGTQPIKGRLDEDLGADFRGSTQVPSTRASNRNEGTLPGGSKGKGREGGNGTWDSGALDDSFDMDLDASRDELDIISPAKSWEIVSKKLKATRVEDAAIINRERHEYNRAFLPKKKFPNFKKNKPKAGTNANVAIPSPSSNRSQETVIDGLTYKYPSEAKSERPTSPKQSGRHPPKAYNTRSSGAIRNPTLSKPFKVPTSTRTNQAGPSATTISHSKQSINSVLDMGKSKPPRKRNKDQTKRHPSLPRDRSLQLIDDDKTTEKTPRPAPDSKYRAVGAVAGRKVAKVQGPKPSRSSSSAKTPRAKHSTRRFMVHDVSNSSPIDVDSSSESEGIKGVVKVANAPRPFPMQDLSPVTSEQKPFDRDAGTKGECSGLILPTAPPVLRPPCAAKSSRLTKVNIVLSSKSSEDAQAQKHTIRDFPMDSQLLESIENFPSPGKRVSGGSDHEDVSLSQRKKQRRESDEARHDDPASKTFDSDLHFFDPRIDPSTLCPWCDEPLPPTPSPLLTSLIAAVRRKSSRDPRPTNPQGLWASPAIFAHVCARHTFEEQHIPMAEAHGWPTRINWSELGERIGRLKKHLQSIIDDQDERFAPGKPTPEDQIDNSWDTPDDEDELLQLSRPRKGSIFWRDVVNNVKKQGSKQAFGVRGQFSNFDKTQPGYYGELGYVILNQVIYDLFPPSSFKSDSTLPLIPSEFIQLILIPEAALALIMEDLSQSRKTAIEILRESAEYGVAMFPDEGGTNVGENIVRQRAKNRRKELGDEEDEGMSETTAMSEPAVASTAHFNGKQRRRPRKKPQPVAAESSDGEGYITSRNRIRKPASGGTSKGKKLEKKFSQQHDIITISDSSQSVCQPEPAVSQPKPRPTRKPTSRTASTSSFRADDVKAIDIWDSDVSDCLVAATSYYTSQGRNPASSSEKEDVHRYSDTENDVESDSHTIPPFSLTMREVTWGPDGKYQITDRSSSVVPPSDTDETPKIRRTISRTSSTSSIAAVVGTSGSVFPLGMVMRRPRDKLIIEKPVTTRTSDDKWLTNMKDKLSEDDSSA